MEQGEPRKEFTCCDKKFLFKEVMDMHKDVMHSNKVETKLLAIQKKEIKMETFSCPYPPCKFHCKKQSFLTRHIKSVHESIATDTNKTCPTCGITLGKNTKLANHIRVVHTGQLHQCEMCSHMTRNISSLKLHFKARHTELMNKSCEFCGKVVKNMKNHLKVTMCGKDVDNRKMLQCPKCDKKKMNKSQLLEHIKHVHDGEKDIQCPNCSYKTYSKWNLRLHMSSVHEKPILFKNCPHCKIRTRSLSAHIATYHNEHMQGLL